MSNACVVSASAVETMRDSLAWEVERAKDGVRTPAIASGPAWLLALAFLTPYLICVALFVHGGRARRRSQQDLGAAGRRLAALEPERVPLEAEPWRG